MVVYENFKFYVFHFYILLQQLILKVLVWTNDIDYLQLIYLTKITKWRCFYLCVKILPSRVISFFAGLFLHQQRKRTNDVLSANENYNNFCPLLFNNKLLQNKNTCSPLGVKFNWPALFYVKRILKFILVYM